MKYKTLFRVICKAIGVYFFIWGMSGVIAAAGNAVAYFLARNSNSSVELFYLIGAAGSLFEIAAGCYLFFDGRLIADWAIPGNRKYCPECGYDLNNSVSGICSECGTHAEVGRPD
jgi:hypothetical protein